MERPDARAIFILRGAAIIGPRIGKNGKDGALAGLDIGEHGSDAYPNFVTNDTPHVLMDGQPLPGGQPASQPVRQPVPQKTRQPVAEP